MACQPVSRQGDQERAALDTGIARRYKANARQVADGHETSTATGSLALSVAILPLTVGISEWLDGAGAGVGKKVKPFFRLLTPELTSTIIARAVLDGISRKRKRTALAGAIGRAIQLEHQLQGFKETHSATFNSELIENKHKNDRRTEQTILKNARRAGIINRGWSRGDLISIGMTALMLMEKHTGMIKIYHRLQRGRRIGLVAPTAEMEAWLAESYRQDGLRGVLYEPMVEPPNDWVDNYTGGYNLEEFQSRGFINAKEGKHYDDLKAADCPRAFAAVNTLQSTAWKVNTKVLAVMRTLWEERSTIAGLPDCDFLAEPDYPVGASKAEQRQHFREVQRIHATNSMNVGRRFRLNTSIKTAEKFSGESAIYFPHHLDFRGRAYPLPKVFSPQGDDVAKGLLLFAEGKVMDSDAYRWFLIHGANLWGFKGSLANRIAQVLGMRQHIMDSAANPLDWTEWARADSPFQFLAWCLEFAAHDADPAHPSHIPCAMDGSNNGLQLMSLLLRDKDIGSATNCTPQDRPADIYQKVADAVTHKLEHDPTKGNLELLRYGIDRKLMKRVVMSVPYGASYFTIIQLFQDTMYSSFIESGRLPFGGRLRPQCAVLAGYTWGVIQEMMPRALDLMAWIKDTIRPAVEADTGVSWVTPIGLRVYQGYRQTVRRRVVTAIGSKIRKEAFYKDPLDSLSARDNLKAIVPNFIHSLDSSVMLATVNRMKLEGVNSLAMVHDSFATHAADAATLARGLREETIGIFQNNLLESFDKDIRCSYSLTHESILTPPIAGELDISDLLKSLYFFH